MVSACLFSFDLWCHRVAAAGSVVPLPHCCIAPSCMTMAGQAAPWWESTDTPLGALCRSRADPSLPVRPLKGLLTCLPIALLLLYWAQGLPRSRAFVPIELQPGAPATTAARRCAFHDLPPASFALSTNYSLQGMSSILEELLGRQRRQDRARSWVVEVGSCDGSEALMAAEAGYRVLSFEPSPRNWKAIQRDPRMTQSAVEWRRLAASNASGAMSFCLGRTSDSRKDRLLTRSDEPCDGPVHAVPVATLDQSLADVPGPILLLKVDAEGFDGRVLQGAQRLLARARPPRYILFEFNRGGWPPAGARPPPGSWPGCTATATAWGPASPTRRPSTPRPAPREAGGGTGS